MQGVLELKNLGRLNALHGCRVLVLLLWTILHLFLGWSANLYSGAWAKLTLAMGELASLAPNEVICTRHDSQI